MYYLVGYVISKKKQGRNNNYALVFQIFFSSY